MTCTHCGGTRFVYFQNVVSRPDGVHLRHEVREWPGVGKSARVALFQKEADARAYAAWRNDEPITSSRSGSNPPPSTPPPITHSAMAGRSSWGEYQTAYPGS